MLTDKEKLIKGIERYIQTVGGSLPLLGASGCLDVLDLVSGCSGCCSTGVCFAVVRSHKCKRTSAGGRSEYRQVGKEEQNRVP